MGIVPSSENSETECKLHSVSFYVKIDRTYEGELALKDFLPNEVQNNIGYMISIRYRLIELCSPDRQYPSDFESF